MMIPIKGEQVRCPRCGSLMSKRKKKKHYWKCWRNGSGCKAILKANGRLVVKKEKKKGEKDAKRSS